MSKNEHKWKNTGCRDDATKLNIVTTTFTHGCICHIWIILYYEEEYSKEHAAPAYSFPFKQLRLLGAKE